MGKLRDLAGRAGRWLGLSTPPALHTSAIVGDRFDLMSWRETYDQASALRELAEDLRESHDYTADLLRDYWTAAYKSAPQVRPRQEMDPSRAVNHQIMAAALQAPEFAELRRETVGDPYAAAMAVLSQAEPLRRMLEETTREAQQAAERAGQARERAAQAAADVRAALEAAAEQAGQGGADPDEVPQQAADAVGAAIAAAEAAQDVAEQADAAAASALAQSAPAIRQIMRKAAAEATEQARDEAALMTAWGLGSGELTRMDFPTRQRLAERLRGGRLGRFTDLIGRFRLMAQAERAHRTEHGTGELVGITLGDDLGRLIPSELASLGVPAMRAVFAARLAEGRLMTYETRGEERTGQGAIIAVVDCSYSMTKRHDGITREAWAKALSLALLDQARQGRRAFAGILFASDDEQQVFQFPARQRPRIGDVVDFAESFFGGGTDFAAPLDIAAELLERQYNTDGAQKGDIVFITDGECGVTEEWMRAWQERKHRLGFRVFGVSIAETPGPVLEALSDNLRTVTDLTDPGSARDMFRVI